MNAYLNVLDNTILNEIKIFGEKIQKMYDLFVCFRIPIFRYECFAVSL